MEFIDGVFYVVILIVSVVIHEFAHGYMAYRLGDQTARMAGRLTLNPLKHLDMFGSIVLPLLLIITKAGFVIGWARPVPYNPRNLRNGKQGTLLVAIAGICANLAIAIIFGLLIRFAPLLGLPPATLDPNVIHPFYHIATTIVLLNIVLAVFNLVPIPPLDGSKILFSILPVRYRFIEEFLERWALFVLLFFILFLWNVMSPIIFTIFSVLTGM
ncbi:MAG: site-2 protease family protein [Candidatus Paceibacterota bacterium]